MSSPSAGPLTGEKLPREVAGFRLRREIGRGGMGVVYEAEEISSGRRVALKVLLADLAVSEVAYERFQREARLAAAISHEHCVFVYGAHQIEGSPAIAMEIVDGETLEHKIARQEPIPIETAVRWTIDLIDGLEAAHKAGILHRDVKPSNCFVTNEGRVKVGDFGLSRTLELDVQLTQTGQFLGSPLYASPEQVRGRALDGRSDLYSCGATLYAILTGRAPHSGSNVGEVLARILTESPEAPSSIRSEIPRALDRVVLKAMEREPSKRFADLAEFREALAPFATSAGGIAPRWRRIVAYIIDSAVLSLATAGLFAIQQVFDISILRISDEPMSKDSLPGEIVIQVFTFAYFLIGEGLLGTTIGKWLLGLRVVSVSTREKSLGGAALRGLVFQGSSVLVRLSALLFAQTPVVVLLWASLGPLIMLALTFVTARRRNGWRGVHELASGTIVTPVTSPFRQSSPSVPPPEVSIAKSGDLPERVGDYAVEGFVGATLSGRIVKARDATLERSVWIHVPASEQDLANEGRRTLSRRARLRWLGTVEMPGGRGDVFESPGGTSLVDYAARNPPLEWWRAVQLLSSLVHELRADPNSSAEIALEQIWVDRNWNLRVIDRPIGEGPFQHHAPIDLVRKAAAVLFQGAGTRAIELPRDLPGDAETTVRRLLGHGQNFASLDLLATELQRLEQVPPRLQARARTAQLAVNAFAPAGFVLFVLVAMLLIRPILITGSYWQEIKVDEKSRETMNIAEILNEDERTAYEVLLLDSLNSTLGADAMKRANEKDAQLLAQIRERHPKLSAEDVANARRIVDAMPENQEEESPFDPIEHPYGLTLRMSLIMSIVWTALGALLAFAFRGGFTMMIFGIMLRDKLGRRAPRWICTVRVLLAGLPVVAGLWLAVTFLSNAHPLAAGILTGLTAVAWLVLVVGAMRNPTQSIVDRILSTRLVSR